MAGPWEKYQQAAASQDVPPWVKYGGASVAAESIRPAGLPAGMDLPQPPTHPAVNMQPAASTVASRLFGSGHPLDAASVVGSHLKNLVAGPYHAFADAPRNAEEVTEKGAGPDSGTIANGLGQFGLGMARMFVNPTRDALAELPSSKNATDVMNHLTDAIPVAGPWARSIENEAQDKGVIPALMGSAVDAFAPDVVGGILGKIREAAPSMAEGAMNIRRGDRGFGKTPGRAILDETTGFRPETVGKQAQAKLKSLTPQIDALAASHTSPIDISPAIGSIDDAIDTAKGRNNVSGVKALGPVRDQLTENPFELNQPFAAPTVGNPNAVISPMQTAIGALNLKRGLRDQFVKNWSPDAASILTRDTAKGASHALDESLDAALGPEFSEANQRISSLIPVTEAAEKLSRADELPQKFGDKLKAHTGALTSAVAGGLAGAHSGGLAGGIGGALGGFILPEAIASPTTRMIMARGMNSTIPSTVLRPLLTGGALTIGLPKESKSK